MKRRVIDWHLRTRWLLAATLASTLAVARPATAQTGTVTGRVTESQTGRPVSTARVTVTGTTLGAEADADGQFRIANVPVSARELRARSIGYLPAAATFSITAGMVTNVAITMLESATALDEVVITGTVGDTRRRAIGNAVTTVNAVEVVGRSAVSNITEMLQAKTPGLTLMPGSGSVGTSANYRLRGAGSLYAGNNPTIYVDGVRITTRVRATIRCSDRPPRRSTESIPPISSPSK